MKKDQEQGLYIISIAARLAEVHPQTLRIYERKGLLCPARTPKNRRRYSNADISRLRHIQELTQREGLNLSGVRKVLEMEDELAGLREKVQVLESEMARMHESMLDGVREFKRQVALSRRPPADLVIRSRKGGR
ncbi:MAG: MerR family transcriptional regulator [Actinobacteria bacterium]|nr:MerR family transcriptional regulator [Actinomycetota bacterium]